MNSLTRAFLLGLSILLPVVLSIQLIIWLGSTVESWLKTLWLLVLSDTMYFPGLALISFIALTTLVGLLSRLAIIRGVLKLPGRAMERIPLVRYIYSTIKDFLDLIGGKTFSDQSVVWVTLPQANARLLGIVTKSGDDKSARLSSFIEDDEVAVYLPMSYQAGGYMLVVSRDQIEKTDMSPGEALHLIMSAGLGQQKR
ncbi:MAG: DUF502 domain-containing protein [Pseudomonadales bacterium]|nr:DUF502 domain-containing protein [Pseudomonadales bacterium]